MKQLGLIGFPLSHSFSKKYFTEKFTKEGIEGFQYELYPIEKADSLLNILQANPALVGLNVTIPHKLAVMPFLHELDETAKAVGAVNTIAVTRDSMGNVTHLKGYNTDVYGFEMSLKPLLQPNHYKALILGTGGAAKAVTYVLNKLGIEYMYASRTKGENTLTYDEVNKAAIAHFQLIINTTPLGTYPKVDDCAPLPYEYITDQHFLYDLVYNPELTKFLSYGKEKGSVLQNGLPMLKLQAEKAWQIWNNQ